ncbi:hypothetical protein ACTFIY_003852 [Dictyostelium cf. discoideum]
MQYNGPSVCKINAKAIRRAKESSTAKRAADVPSASDDANTVPKDAEASKAKSKKTIRPIEVDDDMYTTESTDESEVEVREKEPKKSKTNSIETKTIDALKNAATAVIFMNLFTVHCSQNGVDPTLKTLMDNGAASNELLQSLQPTHNESVKNNDRIEGETLKKLINRNFRSKTLVSIKTDYEAANIKVVDAITNRNCQSAQDVIKNIEAIMSYNNVINPVYLIHGTAEVQLEYLRSILDSNILALLKMVVPDWLQTDVAIKLNTQTDITECREAITELVLNNADKFSRKRSSDSLSNNGEKFPMKKNHAVPNHNSHNRVSNDAQADKIRATILPESKGDSKVNLTKIRNSFLVYRFTKGYCLNCGRSNHKTSNCRLDPVDSKVDLSVSQYHHLEDYDFPVNKDSLYTLNSFYNQNIVTQLHQQNQQHDVHKNINKLKEYVKDSYGILVINFPLLDVKEEFVEQINIQVNNEIDTFFIIELDIIDSNQLHCNVKAPRKHVTVTNDNQSDPNSILDDDDDIKEQVAKFVESIPSQLCDILAKTNPEEEEIQVLRDFINDSFEDVIVDKLPDIPDQINNSRRGNIIHNIIIKKDQDVEPTKKQIYFSTDEHKRHVEEMVLKFIDLGIIKRSESNYSSPIMLLKKRYSFRVVHDYRQLNKVTVRDDHPFTPVDSLLNQCKDSKLFSKFDMIMGYFQVLINPEHAKYTAFITHIGKFEYTRMPQVYYNTLMIYWFTQNSITWFISLKSLECFYIVGSTYYLFQEKKSEILKTEVDFLGFHIHKDGISPRAAKVRAISELPEPRNAKEAEAALESKGKNKKTLSDESLKEFNNLKKEFEGENIVAIPIEQDNNTPIDIEKVKASTDMPIHSDNNNLNNGSFHLYCDVSDKALSGVLYQIQGDKFKVIWFHSRKLTDTQKRYSIGDREFLSIIDSLKKFQHLLIGKKVTIYTDHQNLTYIINKSNDKPFTKRQDNYMKYIKEFDYELRHISGKKKGIADFLSRKYDNFQWDESFLNKIKEEQINSQWLLEMKKNPNLCIEEINDICYLSEDGFKKLIIIDKETIHTIIREYHDTKYSGHHALDITYNNIRQVYYFKEMFSIIKRYIKSCAICQLNINRKDNGILQSLEIPFEVWRDISIDFLSLPKTTYALNGFTVEVDQVCVIVCRLSKMVHIVPCHKTIDAEHTAQLLLNHVFRLHGYPRTIVSDRNPRFLSDIWSRWAKTMNSKLKMTVAHRAQADGQTERMNREIIRILTKASTEYGENWSDIIPLIEFAMNSSMSKSTKMSPFQIVYGFNPPTPVNHFNSLTKTRIPMSNIKKIVRDNILDAQINA